ncbi:MAG: hypothetical protein ACPGJV_10130 [Bacteriovoracaceae bacterium]
MLTNKFVLIEGNEYDYGYMIGPYEQITGRDDFGPVRNKWILQPKMVTIF